MLIIIGSAVLLFGIIIALAEGQSRKKNHFEVLPPDDASLDIPKSNNIPSAEFRKAYFAIRRQAEEVHKKTQDLYFDTRERDLKSLGLEVFWEKKNVENQAQQVDLAANQMEVTNLHRELDQKKTGIEQYAQEKVLEHKKREVELAEHSLLLRFRDLEQNLRDQILNFKSDRLSFQEEVASFQWNIRVQNDLLSIRQAKIELLDRRVRDMYQINSEWLKIQARQNRQDYSDQQAKLKKLYDETQVKIKELRLARWANDLRVDQQEVERRWKIMQFIEEKWTVKYLMRQGAGEYWVRENNPYESLNDLKRAGYTPSSPLLEELAKRHSENWALRQQIVTNHQKCTTSLHQKCTTGNS